MWSGGGTAAGISVKVFPGELGWCWMEPAPGTQGVVRGKKTCIAYDAARPALLVDLRDRNALLATGLFKLK